MSSEKIEWNEIKELVEYLQDMKKSIEKRKPTNEEKDIIYAAATELREHLDHLYCVALEMKAVGES